MTTESQDLGLTSHPKDVEASVDSVSSSLVFFGNSVEKMCSSALYHITIKTRILGAQV